LFSDVIFALWFFLPAGIANAVPVFVSKIPIIDKFNAPMDGGRKFHGKPIFGAHKTWRGLIAGIIFATITLAFQQLAVRHSGWLRSETHQVNYATLRTLIVGPLFAIGALGGDAIESFFKRQRSIPTGHGWFPFDQTDYIIGGAIATMPFVSLSILEYVWLLFLWLVVHIVASSIGYLIGVKDRPI
jgi:CDP-2,3-bis-(O-geranylgeranyl)-sn-glycerol synthase